MAVEPMEAVKSAALSFVDQMPAEVRLAVLEFNTEAQVLAEFTTDRQPVREAIEGLESGGYTAHRPP